jgi:predicted nuclease with TOPRIM domain
MTHKIHQINKKLKRFNNRLNKINFNIEDISNVKELFKDYQQYKTNYNSLLIKVNVLQNNNTELNEKVNVLQNNNTELNEKVNVLQNNNTELNKKVKVLQNNNTELNEKVNVLQNNNTELNEKVNVLQNNNTELNEKVNVLQNNNTELNEKVNVLQNNNTELNKKVNVLQNNNTELNEKVNVLQNNNTDNKSEIKELKPEVKTVKIELKPELKPELNDNIILNMDIIDDMKLRLDEKKKIIVYLCLMTDIKKIKNLELFDIDVEKINILKMLIEKTKFDMNSWEVNKLLSVNKQKYFCEYIQNVFEYRTKIKLETDLNIKQTMFKMFKSLSLVPVLIKNGDNNYSIDKDFIKKYNLFVKNVKDNNIVNIRNMIRNV